MARASTGLVLLMGLAAAGVGCYSDRPHEYGKENPPVDGRTSSDRGLQSKDVIASSDQMAMDLLAQPEITQNPYRMLIVVDKVENLTTSNRFDLNIFLERLRVNLAKYGKGKVQLIENRDKLRELQSRELEGTGGDQFGQGSARPAPGPAGIQPDFSLYGRIMELPNRGTSYFLCEFTLTDLHTRQQVWTNAYEVKVAN
jgi:hypothetical protein